MKRHHLEEKQKENSKRKLAKHSLRVCVPKVECSKKVWALKSCWGNNHKLTKTFKSKMSNNQVSSLKATYSTSSQSNLTSSKWPLSKTRLLFSSTTWRDSKKAIFFLELLKWKGNRMENYPRLIKKLMSRLTEMQLLLTKKVRMSFRSLGRRLASKTGYFTQPISICLDSTFFPARWSSTIVSWFLSKTHTVPKYSKKMRRLC